MTLKEMFLQMADMMEDIELEAEEKEYWIKTIKDNIYLKRGKLKNIKNL